MTKNDGHRERVRQRFLKEGLENFQSYEVLEFILHYSIPRKDTKDIAKDLIAEFGSVDNVINAEAHRLMKIKGIGKKSAAFFKLFDELQQYRKIEVAGKGYVKGTKAVGELAMEYLQGCKKEYFYITFLDAKGKIITVEKIAEGGIDSVSLNLPRVVDSILKYPNVRDIVLMHNHPSGNDNPSGEDIEVTYMLSKALLPFGIGIVDHIIVVGYEYISMRERNLVRE